MDSIKILKIVSKTTKTAKPYKMCEVECGGEVRKVNIWSNAPNFANLAEGSIIVGKMAMDGQYWNISFEGEKPSGGQNYASRMATIDRAMDKKADSIKHFADNKEYAIKLASTMRMAVDLAIAETPEQRETTFQETIRKWRSWLWSEWDLDPKSVDPFND